MLSMVEAESIGEAEIFANIEQNKITEWATENKIIFNKKIKSNAAEETETKGPKRYQFT